jgi:hypothetical protein
MREGIEGGVSALTLLAQIITGFPVFIGFWLDVLLQM